MEPMLAHKVSNNSHGVRLCTNDDWWVEPKVDGERRLITVEGEALRNYNRRGERAPVLSDAIADAFEPFEGDWAFDGELMGDGRFIMFDLVRAEGIVTEKITYGVRRTVLETIYAKLFEPYPSIELLQVARTTEEKVALSRKIAEEKGEGMMFKKVNSVYLPGKRSRNMLKWKYVKTADFVVGSLRPEGRDSVEVRLIDPETMELVPVGTVAMTPERLAKVQTGNVIECSYLYVNDLQNDPRLYQPAFRRFRDDKDPATCWLDQLEGTNKYAFESGEA